MNIHEWERLFYETAPFSSEKKTYENTRKFNKKKYSAVLLGAAPHHQLSIKLDR